MPEKVFIALTLQNLHVPFIGLNFLGPACYRRNIVVCVCAGKCKYAQLVFKWDIMELVSNIMQQYHFLTNHSSASLAF